MFFRIRWTILVMLVATACQAAAAVKEPFFFFLLADPQLGMYTQNRGFEREAKNLGTVIAAANRLHPAFVIVCGDLVNKPGDATEIAGYLKITGKLSPEIPLYNVAGNHDVGNTPTPASLAAYRKLFGRDHYSFRVDDMEGIVLDSQLISTPSKAPQAAREQKAWLETALAKGRAQRVRRIMIFQHIPWFLKYPGEKTAYYSPAEVINIPLSTRLQYLNLFHRFGIHYLFAGHYHRNARGTGLGFEMITNGPVGKPLGKDPSGFGIVIVRKNSLNYTYVPLTSIPEKVNLKQ